MKRIVSIVLIMAMICTTVPVFSVYAEAENVDISEGNLISMTKAVELDKVEHNGHTYYIFPHGTVSTWEEAVEYCESLGGHLATITSQEENNFLHEYMISNGYKSAYFGYTDCSKEEHWEWVNNEEVSYENWHSGEPSNDSDKENYAMFYSSFSDGTWNDGCFNQGGTASDTTTFICEWDDNSSTFIEYAVKGKKFEGHIYCIIPNGTVSTWEQAVEYCEELGGYLATITGEEENNFLYDYMTSLGYKSAYFGYTDCDEEGNWKYVNGEETNYENWHNDEPSNDSNKEHYAMFYSSFSDGTWNDGSFNQGYTLSDTTTFICEWDDGLNSCVEISNEVDGLGYPVQDIESYEKQLELWIKNSDYAEAFAPWIETYSYKDILNMTINLPVMADDGQGYLIKGETTIKELMAYIMFADLAQDYIDAEIEKAEKSIKNNKASEAYTNFLKVVKNFNVQFNTFQEKLNQKDTFNQTLQTLLVAKTALTAVDALEKNEEDEWKSLINYKYFTNFYKATVSEESPDYYDDLKYYILSGGDKKYLNEEYADTVEGYATIIKNAGTIYKIQKEGETSADKLISIGIDNLSYFADTYELPIAEEVKKVKEAWEWADKAMSIVSAVSKGSLVGLISGAWDLSTAYIDEVKKVYDNVSNTDAGWYALTYYYLGLNNESLLKAMIDEDTGNAAFSINRFVTYGFPVDYSDVIEKSIAYYYEDKAYQNYTYTPSEDFRLYLWNACNTMVNIRKMDCNEYRDMMLEYILAELNFENGDVGVPFEVSLSANDDTLGAVNGTGEYISGNSVTVTATPYENVTFAGWKNLETGETVSTDDTFQFSLYQDTELQAEFIAGDVEIAKVPIISTQPSGTTYYAGQQAEALDIEATTGDDGTLRVDWYRNSMNINSGGEYVGSGTSIYPDTCVQGTYYYYAVVTNTKSSTVGTNVTTTTAVANSNTARITVEAPMITSLEVTKLPDKQKYVAGEELVAEGMEVSVSYSDGTSQVVTEYRLEYDFSTEGIQTVVVKMLAFEDSFTVNVVGVEEGLLVENSTLEVDFEKNKIYKSDEESSYETFIENFALDVIVTDAEGTEITAADAYIATGDKLKVEHSDGNTILECEIVVKGDVTGDGLINVVDMEAIQKDILGIYELTDIYLEAAMINHSDRLSVLDMESIQKYILGISF